MNIIELKKMQKELGYIKTTLNFSWSPSGFDIDGLNDHASEEITGDACGLEDISYELVGCNVNTQEVIVRVTGNCENWLKENHNFEV